MKNRIKHIIPIIFAVTLCILFKGNAFAEEAIPADEVISDDVEYIDSEPDVIESIDFDPILSDYVSSTSNLDYESCLSDDCKKYVIDECNRIVSEIITPEMSDIEKYWTIAGWEDAYLSYAYKPDSFEPDPGLHTAAAYGVLKNGKAVCAGYAELYKLLCHAADLPCDSIYLNAVPGIADSHAINYIPDINGHDYLCDITWHRMFMTADSMYRYTDDGPILYKDVIDYDVIEENNINFNCNYKDFVVPAYIVQYRDYTGLSMEKPDLSESGIRYGAPVSYVETCHYEFKPSDISMGIDVLLKMAKDKAIDPYIEMGSGVRNTSCIKYEDYAKTNPVNIGVWYIDDFSWNPKGYLEEEEERKKTEEEERRRKELTRDIKDCVIEGISDSYVISEEDNILDIMRKDMRVLFEGKELIENVDYYVSCFPTVDIPEGVILSFILYGRTGDGSYYCGSKSFNKIVSVTRKKESGNITPDPKEEEAPKEEKVEVKEKEVVEKNICLVLNTTTSCDELIGDDDYSISSYNGDYINIDRERFITAKKKTKNTLLVCESDTAKYNISISIQAKPGFKIARPYDTPGQEDNMIWFFSGHNGNLKVIKWTSSNPSIAKIDNDGNVMIGSKSGSTTITAYFSEKNKNHAKSTIKVSATLKTKIPTLAKSTVKVKKGKTVALTMKNVTAQTDIEIISADDGIDIIEQTNKKGIKTIKVKGVSRGTYNCIISLNDIQYSCSVIVN